MPAGKLYKYKPSKLSKTKVDKKQDKQIKKNTTQLKKLSKAEELKYMDGSFPNSTSSNSRTCSNNPY